MESPNKKMLSNERERYSSFELLATVENVANKLYLDGVRPHAAYRLCAIRSVDTIIVLLALQLIGAKAIMCDEGGDVKITFSVQKCAKRTELLFQPCQGKIVVYTSGSTGEKKGVVIAEKTWIENSLDTQPLGDYRKDDKAILLLPLSHVFGLSLVLTGLVLSYEVFIPEGKNKEENFSFIETEQITRMNGVPSLYRWLAEGNVDTSSLRCGLIGGAPLGEKSFLELEERLQMTLIPVYGMSECLWISCASFQDDAKKRATSVGRCHEKNKIKIERDGEISIISPYLFDGYLGEKAHSGYFSTGDLGYLDEEGFLHVTGRKKDIIIDNGNNLSARFLEEVILSVSGVTEAIVVGVRHPKYGEVACAYLVKSDEASEKEIQDAVSRKLKKPYRIARFMFGETIPLTENGKPNKQQVRKIFETRSPSVGSDG